MVLLYLSVENFRGVRELNWTVGGRFVCLMGPGDSTKSTILDAIDLVLSPRWKLDLDDSDFYGGDTARPIRITATVGEVPESFRADSKFGHDLRGWSNETGLHDEPDDDHEAVLSVELRVDSSLEPRWYVVNDRNPDGRPISSQDREALGVGRIGDFLDRHLTWGRGSALSRLTGKGDDLSQIFADAVRAARSTLNPNSLPVFQAAAERVKALGHSVGVAPKTEFNAHLDVQSVSVHSGGLALHDGDVPLRRTGLGTRRLLALAVQRHLMEDGGIALVDEVEHGLEPHRMRRLLRALCGVEGRGQAVTRKGQVLMTTHSEIVVDEVRCEDLRIVRSEDGKTEIFCVPSALQKDIRKVPEALLARAILVCEGETEVGFCRALDDWWVTSLGFDAMSLRGVVPVDGGGNSAGYYAVALRKLGYPVAYFCDSDRTIQPDERTLIDSGIEIIRWSGDCALEDRVLRDLPWNGVVAVLRLSAEFSAEDKIRAAVIGQVGTNGGLVGEFETWTDSVNLRKAIGAAAKDGGWFKRVDHGERLGAAIAMHLSDVPMSDLGKKVATLRSWIDRDG